MNAVDLRTPQSPLPVFAQSGDLAAPLPAPVRKKFKALREKAERARMLSREISERRMALMAGIPDLEDQIAAMTLPTSHRSRSHPGRGLPEGAGEVRQARLQLASMKEDLGNLNAQYGNRETGALGSLVSALEGFIGRRGRPVFEIVRAEAPHLPKGVTLPAAIETRRRRIRELDADLESVKRAPWPSSISKQRALEQIIELSKRGRPDVFGLVERGAPIGWPMMPETSESPDAAGRVDAAALIAWAMGPALVAAIDREIADLSDDEKALTDEQRKERTEQILADKLEVEREEETLIDRADAEGLPVNRRANADPRAVLGIRQ